MIHDNLDYEAVHYIIRLRFHVMVSASGFLPVTSPQNEYETHHGMKSNTQHVFT